LKPFFSCAPQKYRSPALCPRLDSMKVIGFLFPKEKKSNAFKYLGTLFGTQCKKAIITDMGH
jgi:hypothetical protein